MASLVAKTLTGRDDLVGVPSMIATFGAAAGAVSMTALSRRAGRRPAFILGYLFAAIGISISLVSVLYEHFLIFLFGMTVLGFGRSVSALSRYAAGDLAPPEHRGKVISLVVWAATIGSVIGPLLISPSGRVLERLTGNELGGSFAVGAVGFSVASLVLAIFLRPEPLTLIVVTPVATDQAEETEANREHASESLTELIDQPGVILALFTLAISQLVMVMVMAMTPVHIRAHGQALDMVGWVMMAHTLGMFAISPITGMLVDRLGTRLVIGLAVVVLVGSCLLSATAGNAEPVVLIVSLFLLGAGWNFGFVAGSTALTENVKVPQRLRLQGLADSITWISGGLGALASGLIVSATSYPFLGVVGACLAMIPIVPLFRNRNPKTAQ